MSQRLRRSVSKRLIQIRIAFVPYSKATRPSTRGSPPTHYASRIRMSEPETKCPGCDNEMRPIKLNDATGMHFSREGARHVEPTYSAKDTKANWFTNTVPAEGTVKAHICTGCGQIVLFGVPKQS